MLDGCSSTLEFFLVKYMFVFLFQSSDTKFNDLNNYPIKILKLKKPFELNFILIPRI